MGKAKAGQKAPKSKGASAKNANSLAKCWAGSVVVLLAGEYVGSHHPSIQQQQQQQQQQQFETLSQRMSKRRTSLAL